MNTVDQELQVMGIARCIAQAQLDDARRIASLVAAQHNDRRGGKRLTIEGKAQRDVFVACRITASDLKRFCECTYLRGRDMRAGLLAIRKSEAECLPRYVLDKLTRVLPHIKHAKRSATTTHLSDRHANAAQEQMFS